MPGPSLRSEFVRFHQPAERGGEAVADLLATTRGLELVDVEIHRDRGAGVSHLPLDADGIKPALREVRAVCVAKIVEGELRDPGGVWSATAPNWLSVTELAAARRASGRGSAPRMCARGELIAQRFPRSATGYSRRRRMPMLERHERPEPVEGHSDIWRRVVGSHLESVAKLRTVGVRLLNEIATARPPKPAAAPRRSQPGY